ncbi:hypothetical protein PVOR_09480 [Paenibacillus vortex V453]|uniref:ClpX-type ZB domain-containing protein n=2 Tax=Paenibacillus TaxID=44249 RepID=A0A162ELS4_9BACL|nr:MULTISPECIES: ClpX C4-type zinc finger protein [Paenibacillus]EFU42486.1 hypothetical protein PVOR_09480 [Paenibacillus vortex V453]KZS47421.1 hypothetical protein AWU65_16535 [Paenibacillus glucanolyticus]MDH6674745.1 hypothetical protein [Paenibacillus sp. LBL]
MDQEFRKKMFRGAKIEDTILELEKLSLLCESYMDKSESIDRQRFYEGMAIAYTTVALKLKGEFDYIDRDVIGHLYEAAAHNKPQEPSAPVHTGSCSFCNRSKDEVGPLALGPGVSICGECLEFGKEVMGAPQP